MPCFSGLYRRHRQENTIPRIISLETGLRNSIVDSLHLINAFLPCENALNVYKALPMCAIQSHREVVSHKKTASKKE